MKKEKTGKPKKVLVLGSGALKIGEAGEFDYSGSQALKALKEEGIKTVLVNPNIATVQTSQEFADALYLLPVNAYFVEKVIEKEKPDGILLGFGGQTALNCGIELHRKGIIKKHNIKVLGTQIDAIETTEDRELFVNALAEINVKVPNSFAVSSKEQAMEAVKKIGFPTIVRVAYALGGRGSGIANNNEEFTEIVEKAFSHSKQILVEEYLEGWKEIEYEVVRDKEDNCVTVCNMENFDPMGIHTGESIVVAPSQTLTNTEYHKLREISIKVIRHLGIVGECNIQFALDPKSEDYRVIEVNARLSRSSALASKATGYPLAFVATKLALNYPLTKVENKITKKTMACFEPALDYLVMKMPRWDLQKFKKVKKEIGTEMKSVGEVMAIGRNFEEVIQKAIRMLNIGMYGLVLNKVSFKGLEKELSRPTDKRLFAIVEAIKSGYSIDKIHELTRIDKWFLYKIENIVNIEKNISKQSLEEISKEQMLKAKQAGFSDKQISMLDGKKDELYVRKIRKKLGVNPSIKQIDTLAAEYPAESNYLYVTYHGTENDIPQDKENKIIVLGSGPYSIGSSVEFDWCCVSAINTLKKEGVGTIMINSNPETVSTDYDVSDKLYFEELSLERVLDVYEYEKAKGIIISTGGQIPNNLAIKLHKANAKILGTRPEDIDRAENRNKFSGLCDKLEIDQPAWRELSTEKSALEFSEKVGYPVLVRPSYVLSGAAMNVAFKEEELRSFLKTASDVSKEHPVTITKFITNAKEIDLDAVANNGEIVAWAINEHVENAGVHSGDATMVLPPQKTYIETMRRIRQIASQLAKELSITGPFNVQFIAKDNEVKVIECNLRASRSFPFVSKVTGKNFIEIAVKSALGKKVELVANPSLELDYVGVKAPQFSFSRLKGADPILSVEMASTGEVACLGNDLEDAFLKSIISTGMKMPKKNVLVAISGEENKWELLEEIKMLKKAGFNLYATHHTHYFLKGNLLESEMLHKVYEKKKPNVLEHLTKGDIDFVINIPTSHLRKEYEDEYVLRRAAVDFGIPLLTNVQVTKMFVKSVLEKKLENLEIKSWQEYVEGK